MQTHKDAATRVRLECAAFEAIKAGLESAPDLLHDPEALLMIAEGETDLIEAIDLLLRGDLEDKALLAGLEAVCGDLNARHARLEARTELRRALLEQALMLLECKSLERPLATVSLVARPPALLVTDEAQIPTRFFVAKPSLDRRALKAALEQGEALPGAALSNGVLTLTIRRR